MKTLSLLCTLALLFTFPVTGGASDDAQQLHDAMQYTAYAYIYAPRAGEAAEYGIDGTEAARMVYAHITGGNQQVPLILPADFDGDPASYRFQGVRLTFDTPVGYSWSGNRILDVTFEGEVIRPAKVELMANASYGVIAERGEDFIVQEMIFDTRSHPGPVSGWEPEDGVFSPQYTITPETVFSSNAALPFDGIFVVGYGCEIIADEEDNILSIVGSNG